MPRTCVLMSAAVTFNACRRTGSSCTRTSRSTPPWRVTLATPRTDSNRLLTMLSTNQERSSASMSDASTAYVNTGRLANVTREMTGSCTSDGNCARMRLTESRTSFTASCTSFSSWNSTIVVELPSLMVDVMCLIAPMLAILSSILRVTSVSICVGVAPGRLAVTDTAGKSMSGKFWIDSILNDTSPATVIRMNSRIDGMGLRIAQAEKFMAWHRQRRAQMRGRQTQPRARDRHRSGTPRLRQPPRRSGQCLA